MTHDDPRASCEASIRAGSGLRGRIAASSRVGGVGASRRGLTLLELLLVMIVISLLLGGGIGVITNIDFSRRATAGSVLNLIRSARNSAVTRSAPCRVRIDPKAGTVSAEAMRVIGTWHFEDNTPANQGLAEEGGLGIHGSLLGAKVSDDGFLGTALRFEGGTRGQFASFPVEDDPGFRIRQGFSMSFAIKPEEKTSGRVLDLGGSVQVELDRDGGMKVILTPEVEGSAGTPNRGGRVTLESGDRKIRPGRWTRVQVDYDRANFALLFDGVRVGLLEESAPVWRIEKPMVLGDRTRGFAGLLDSLVVSGVVAEETLQLPEGTAFAADTPKEIRFDAGGHLDVRMHEKPVQFDLVYDDGRTDTLRVGRYGTIE